MRTVLKFRKVGWKKGLLNWAFLVLFCCGCFLIGAGAYYLYDSNVQENKIDSIQIHVKEKPIKVSVIIPIYNTAPYLERCLDSAINQTLKDIEIICVNDGSIDNSLEILNKYAQKDKRVKVISHEKNKGVSVARNTAIRAARGEFIGFLDSDDFVDRRYFKNLYNNRGNHVVIKGLVLHNGVYSWKSKAYYWAPGLVQRKFLLDHKIEFPEDYKTGEDRVFYEKIEKLSGRFKVLWEDRPKGLRDIYYHRERRKGSLTHP